MVGVSFDGTGYGDDGSIWGGEILCRKRRRQASSGLPTCAARRCPAAMPPRNIQFRRRPVFWRNWMACPILTAAPFNFSERHQNALELIRKEVRTFATTSVGRLFDAAAALLGFTREVTFEGQAAMWLEQLARGAPR